MLNERKMSLKIFYGYNLHAALRRRTVSFDASTRTVRRSNVITGTNKCVAAPERGDSFPLTYDAATHRVELAFQ
uniref:Uncharacterized protein n=1 Tax=Pararge aegeria TaxID=116150 RepID=S4PXD2_9NEOP